MALVKAEHLSVVTRIWQVWVPLHPWDPCVPAPLPAQISHFPGAQAAEQCSWVLLHKASVLQAINQSPLSSTKLV